MQTVEASRPSAKLKRESMLAGKRVILTDYELDALTEDGLANDIRTALNADCVGTLPRYIGWIHASAAPKIIRRDDNGMCWARI